MLAMGKPAASRRRPTPDEEANHDAPAISHLGPAETPVAPLDRGTRADVPGGVGDRPWYVVSPAGPTVRPNLALIAIAILVMLVLGVASA